MRSARCVDPSCGEQLVGALVVELVVLLPPPAEHGVRGGDDHVVHPLPARDPLGERGTGEPDPRPQLEDVDLAEHLAEQPATPAVGGSGPRPPVAGWSCPPRSGR